jgi:hypothetical protein
MLCYVTTAVTRRKWEQSLVARAFDGYTTTHSHEPVDADPEALEYAYRECEAITRRNSQTFHLATRLLPRAKGRALRALYAFRRTTDDIVDGAHTYTATELAGVARTSAVGG